ncbi:PH domain-containing protein [Ornithinibacillus halotolerans]|uniref:UPF0699 transmembrane protein YdbT n=1 Tax=Ornithinibacillus halotolerans TaxID=1274357 RepID=A0A916WFD0_9BACI|nr:PH domain-containing protein [Ornithinibacillus halotolerans]GGA92715.1 UPF0699 transmembrane protein YdbT [Ornithinibacillus halotolerans]
MSKPERLHPATIVFNIIKGIRDSIFIIIIAIAGLMDVNIWYAVLGITILILLIVLMSYLSWSRFTYYVEEEELRLEYGIFIRKKRFIAKNRIQSIDLTQNILHRIFKLVKVEIETAGTGADAEASLNAVTLLKGEALRAQLKSQSINKEESVEEETISDPTQTITSKGILIAGATSGSVGVLIAIAAGAISELERFIPEDFFNNAYQWVIGLGLLIIIFMIIGGLILLWLIGIIGTVIRYWNFTITKIGEDIVITRGLLEKKHLTIPLRRIQSIGYVESIIRQPLGYSTVIAEVAGGSNESGEEFSTVIFPIMKTDEVSSFIRKFFPDYQMEEIDYKLPKRALKYYITRMLLPSLIAFIAVIIIVPYFTWIPILLIVLSILLGIMQYRDTGFTLEDSKVTIRYRFLSRVTMVIEHKRIQAFNKKQHFLHRREFLATIKLSIIGKMGLGKHFHIKEMEEKEANKLADWYSYRGED